MCQFCKKTKAKPCQTASRVAAPVGFPFHSSNVRVLLAPYLRQRLLLSFHFVVLRDEWWSLFLLFDCMFLTFDDIEHLIISLVATHVFFGETFPFSSC